MNINKFPEEYEDICKNDMNKSIISLREQSEKKIKSMENSVGTEPSVSAFAGGGASIGFTVGFLVCSFVCISEGNCTGSAVGFNKGSVWFFIILAIGVGLGLIIGECLKSTYESGVTNAYLKIEQEKEHCEKMVKEIEENTHDDCLKYANEFEKKSQELSLQYNGSEMADDIIQWITAGFKMTIDSADRRSHVEELSIPFEVKIYQNKITCNLGEYDFKENICSKLSTPLDQAALARVIASAVQLNITMKYPKDISGTEAYTNITYSADYLHGCINASIIYSAYNGNYRPPRNWKK